MKKARIVTYLIRRLTKNEMALGLQLTSVAKNEFTFKIGDCHPNRFKVLLRNSSDQGVCILVKGEGHPWLMQYHFWPAQERKSAKNQKKHFVGLLCYALSRHKFAHKNSCRAVIPNR